MNNLSISNLSVNTKQPSFGTISKVAKDVINSPSVRTILEQKHGVLGLDIRKLDESALHFSLIAENMPYISNEAGLIVSPPKGSRLPNVSLTTDCQDLNQTDSYFFAKMVKKAVDIEAAYRKCLKDFGSHPVKKHFIKRTQRVDNSMQDDLKAYTKAFNSRDSATARELENSLKVKNKIRQNIRKSCSEECFETQNGLISNVVPKWERISGHILA